METKHLAQAAVEITKLLLEHRACIIIGLIVGMGLLWVIKKLKVTG